MQTLGTSDARIVAAAQAGDREALNDLVTVHLPLVYTVVRRALLTSPDVDDVVQETMIRAVRDLGSLRTPESFRPWLVAIALRQIATQQARAEMQAERSTVLDDAEADQIAGGDAEDLAVARVELTQQRRQVVQASAWLDPDDRTVLSVWWLEVVGTLTRTELAAALGITVAHAGVRVQRMRDQLSICRSIVAALESRPRCADLEELLVDWDGRPSSVWRKRMARHLRSCPICGAGEAPQVAPENLLIPFAVLSVPLALSAAAVVKGALAGTAATAAAAGAVGGVLPGGAGSVAGGVAGGAKAGLAAQLMSAIAGHPVAASVAAAVVVAGGAATVTTLPDPTPPPAAVAPAASPSARPTPSPAVGAGVAAEPTRTSERPTTTTTSGPAPLQALRLPLGRLSVESTEFLGFYLRSVGDFAFVKPAPAAEDRAGARAATFTVVRGLADERCYSFRADDGRFLRHSMWRLRLSYDEGNRLFREDSTFCLRRGAVPGSFLLRSHNYPDKVIHHRGPELWLDQAEDTKAFLAASSFRGRDPLRP